MRVFAAGALCVVAVSAIAQSSSLQVHGFVSVRGIRVKAPPSWTEGGTGRFDVGGHRKVNVDVAQAGIDWTPTDWLLIHGDGIARKEPSGTKGQRGGLLQAFADLHSERWRFRAGMFWLPTSRENIDALWTSRYSITYSALNTWIGEEVRPIGIDIQYSPNYYITLGGTVFGGNDTMGTELAARGWTFGNRLSVFNEELPQPPDRETQPIGRDLDGRRGYSERIRLQVPERAILQFTHIDNRAKLVPLLKGYTPWLTRFNIVGATLGTTSATTLSAEWASGWTAVAFPRGSATMDFDTAYVLLSRKSGSDRWTTRVERFSTRDRRRRAVDNKREHGHAVTVAWLRDVSPNLRAGVEYARVKGERGGGPDTGGSTITLELRYGF
jgi:hypothetical protein